jgi:hypothetical protein
LGGHEVCTFVGIENVEIKLLRSVDTKCSGVLNQIAAFELVLNRNTLLYYAGCNIFIDGYTVDVEGTHWKVWTVACCPGKIEVMLLSR